MKDMKIFLNMRKTVQIGVVVSVVLIIMVSYGATLHQVYGPGGEHLAGLMEEKWSFWLYRSFTETMGALREPVRVADGFKGTYWSITVFGLTITDPLAGLGHLVATRSIYIPLIFGMLVPLFAAMTLGRAYCGWICPMNTLLEFTDKLRNRLRRGESLPTKDLHSGRLNKYFLLTALFIAAAISGVSVFPYLMPQLHLGKEVFQVVYFGSISWGIFFICGIILFEILFTRRGWCRYLCPAGALLSLLAVPRLLRVEKTARDCTQGCRSCVDACPLGLEPHTGASMMECSQCGLCLPRCEEGLLGFRWRGNMRLAIFAGVAIAFFALANTAQAHHIRGLPHYGYTENYPQNPTREKVVKHKHYYIYVTTYSFEGLQREKSDTPDDVQFYIYIKNMKTGQPYTGRMEVEITRKGERALYHRGSPDEEAVYRIRHSFEKSRGGCLLNIRFDGAAGREDVRIKIKLN